MKERALHTKYNCISQRPVLFSFLKLISLSPALICQREVDFGNSEGGSDGSTLGTAEEVLPCSDMVKD
jgi:hypothetical protein